MRLHHQHFRRPINEAKVQEKAPRHLEGAMQKRIAELEQQLAESQMRIPPARENAIPPSYAADIPRPGIENIEASTSGLTNIIQMFGLQSHRPLLEKLYQNTGV